MLDSVNSSNNPSTVNTIMDKAMLDIPLPPPKVLKQFAFEVVKQEGQDIYIKGYITNWMEPDRDGDVLDPRNADKGLTNYRLSPIVTMLHPFSDTPYSVAMAVEGTEKIDEIGIYYEYKMIQPAYASNSSEAWEADETRAFARSEVLSGAIRAWSIGANTLHGQEWSIEEITTKQGKAKMLKNYDINHVALCYIPANGKAVFSVLQKSFMERMKATQSHSNGADVAQASSTAHTEKPEEPRMEPEAKPTENKLLADIEARMKAFEQKNELLEKENKELKGTLAKASEPVRQTTEAAPSNKTAGTNPFAYNLNMTKAQNVAAMRHKAYGLKQNKIGA